MADLKHEFEFSIDIGALGAQRDLARIIRDSVTRALEQDREPVPPPLDESTIAARTAALPANVAARARNVAALRKEMDRPWPKLHEGRSERALQGRWKP